jgi:hypothetical protein
MGEPKVAQNPDGKVMPIHADATAAHRGSTVGKIVSVDEDGRASVVFPSSNGVAVQARSVISSPLRAGEHVEDLVGAEVLLAFENEDPRLPVILGRLGDRVCPEAQRPEVELDLEGDRDVVVDGQRLVFDAKQEILLRCGKSTLVLCRDGRVLVRGTHLVSRASGTNKIKGGAISLN